MIRRKFSKNYRIIFYSTAPMTSFGTSIMILWGTWHMVWDISTWAFIESITDSFGSFYSSPEKNNNNHITLKYGNEEDIHLKPTYTFGKLPPISTKNKYYLSWTENTRQISYFHSSILMIKLALFPCRTFIQFSICFTLFHT